MTQTNAYVSHETLHSKVSQLEKQEVCPYFAGRHRGIEVACYQLNAEKQTQTNGKI